MYFPKCKECDMPKEIKAQNTSIKDGCGACSMCYQVKDQIENEANHDDVKVLATLSE